MSYLANETYGLRLIGELDEPELSYEFHMMEVIQHVATGRVFYSIDAGCSCPTPFENDYFNSPDDNSLIEITVGDSFASFQREVDQFPTDMQDRQELLSAVRKALKL